MEWQIRRMNRTIFGANVCEAVKESVDPIGEFKNKSPVFLEEPIRQIVVGVNKINI